MSRPVPHVLHLVATLDVGGAERTLERLARGLDASRWHPIVACLGSSSGPVGCALRAGGIPVRELGLVPRPKPEHLIAVLRLLRRERPEILHCWMFHANLTGRIAGRMARIPVVVTSEHGLGLEGRRRYLLNRATIALADRHICVSEAVAAFARERIGLPASRLVVIRNGVDAEAFAGPRDPPGARQRLGLREAPTVGTVARLVPVKRIERMLGALRGQPGTQLLVVGDGPERERLTARARELGLGDRARFAGLQADPRPWLAAMDVFCLSSDSEGLPVATAEAMAAGLPVVATDVGGVAEVVERDVTGLLVPPGDGAALARALARLLADPERARAMGERGRERVRRELSASGMVRRVEALYEELLARRSRKPA